MIYIEPAFSEYYKKYPLVLVDVGASGGLSFNWQPAKKYLQIIGFEPDKREFANLEKRANNNIKYLNIALYKEKASLDFYLTKKQQTSSIFKPNREFLDKFERSERFNIVGISKLEVDAIDNLFGMHNINDADFMKIDTQGSEYFVLQGAKDTIKKCIFGIEVEVEFVELYQDQPLFAEVDSFVRKQGFHMFDIQGGYWKRAIGKDYGKKKGQLVWGNVLYLRKSEDFCKVINEIKCIDERKSKALKAISICFLYGYFDYAMEIFSVLSHLFNTAERQMIKKTIKCKVDYGTRIREFRGRERLSNILYFLWELLRPTCRGWSVVDKKLGNT